MGAIEIIGGIVLILLSVLILIMVLMQEGKGNGVNALGGGNAQNFGRNRAKTLDVLLEKYTKIAAIAFCVITFLVWILSVFF